MDSDIARCLVHDENSFMYCKTCKRVSCFNCEECKKHEVQTLYNLIQDHNIHLPLYSLKKYKLEANELLEDYEMNVGNTKVKYNELKEAILNGIQNLATSETAEVGDHDLVSESIKYLREVGNKAYTESLKKASQRAVEALDVDGDIVAEIKKMRDSLKQMKINLKKCKNSIKKLRVERGLLEDVASLDENNISQRNQLCLSLLFEYRVVDPVTIAPPSFSDYKSFPGIETIINEELFFRLGMDNIKNNILVSRPTSSELSLRTGDNIYASISHKGILAIHSKIQHNAVQFTSLLYNIQVEVEVEGDTLVGFYDESLIFLTKAMPLRLSSVEALLRTKTTKVMEQIDSGEVECSTDVTLLNSRRVLLYVSLSHIFEYNVDTRTVTELNLEKDVRSLAGFTGIETVFKGVFSTNATECGVFALGMDNSLVPLHNYFTRSSIVNLFIPSSSDPNNAKKGVAISNGGYYMTGSDRSRFSFPLIQGSGFHTIVRLYHDIFLIFNNISKLWSFVRIYTP